MDLRERCSKNKGKVLHKIVSIFTVLQIQIKYDERRRHVIIMVEK
jgi:hypothetical protein